MVLCYDIRRGVLVPERRRFVRLVVTVNRVSVAGRTRSNDLESEGSTKGVVDDIRRDFGLAKKTARMYLVPLYPKMTGKIDDPNIQTPYTGVTGIEHSAQTRISISYYRYYYGRW
jgi:hypothetical protein